MSDNILSSDEKSYLIRKAELIKISWEIKEITEQMEQFLEDNNPLSIEKFEEFLFGNSKKLSRLQELKNRKSCIELDEHSLSTIEKRSPYFCDVVERS